MKTVIIGIGNTLRSDDGVGVIAAEILESELTAPNIEVIACHQLTPELVDSLHQAQHAIFIDADAQNPAGFLSIQSITPAPSALTPGSVSHHFNPKILLGLCQTIYGSCPTAEIFSIGAASFEFGETLSPAVEKTMREMLDKIKKQIE